MSADKKSKSYGLILSKKATTSKPAENQLNVLKKPSVFNNDSSEEEDGSDWRKRSLVQAGQSKVKKQTKLEMSRALEEDPTVYQYDEVYEAMEANKTEQTASAAKAKKEVDKKPRYIENLLKHAEIRNREKERRQERIVQKEREAEGDQFADKESFVTSAYRKKMEEMQKVEEEERKQDMMEDMLTVTKQKDMSGFYRHIYRQTMGEEKGQKEVTIKTEPDIKTEEKIKSEQEIKTEVEDVETQENIAVPSPGAGEKKKVKARSYRTKIQDEDSEPSGNEDSDSQTESSSDSSGGEDNDTKMERIKKKEDAKNVEADAKRRETLRAEKEKRERRKRKIEEGATSSEEEEEEKTEKSSKGEENKENKPREKKIKPDVWTKITVGEVFEAALQRYFVRKAERTRFP